MEAMIQHLISVQESFFFKLLNFSFFKIGSFQLSVFLIIKGILFISIFSLAARFLNKILQKQVYPKLNLENSLRFTLETTVRYLFAVLGVSTLATLLGIDLSAFSVLAGTIGIGIGFGLQDIARNFISGIVLLVERPIKVGDLIEVDGLPGVIRTIQARSTVVDTFDNVAVVVPNADFVSQRIVNWSYSDRNIRMALKVGVAYGSDVRLVERVLMDIAKNHPSVLKTPHPNVLFEAFGESSLDFSLRVWINEPENRLVILSQLNFMTDEAFRENNITIPFPQRDLHVKSGSLGLGAKENL